MAMNDATRRTRRSPTVEQLRIWRSFIETCELVTGQVAARLQSDAGVSPGDYSVMLALFEHPDRRMRSSPLAEAIGWERSRLSHHLGRMERRGLVLREAAVDDNRGAQVALTPLGLQLFRRASAPHLRTINELFVNALDDDQLAAVDDAMRTLRDHLDAPPAP